MEAIRPKTAVAPILVTANKESDLKPLLQYMERLRIQGSGEAAFVESVRLQPYFQDLSRQLEADLQADDEYDDRDRERMRKLSAPGTLTTLFNDVAEFTGNTMLSEVVIVPHSVYEQKNLKDAVFGSDLAIVGTPARYGELSFRFGFHQVYEQDDGGKKSSVTFPILALDSKALRYVSPHKPEKMLRALQAVMSEINHDMLHHFTNMIVNSDFSKKFGPGEMRLQNNSVDNKDPVNTWHDRLFGKSGDIAPQSYESFVLLYQSRLRQLSEDSEEGRALRKNVDVYFGELQRIADDLEKSGAPAAHIHETIDYYNTVMGAMLMRFLPLNHPLVLHALERMEKADPDPMKTKIKAAKTLDRMQKCIGYDRACEEIFANYEAQGYKILPDKGQRPSYAAYKTLQLIDMEQWLARLMSPSAKTNSELDKVQKRAGMAGLDMIEAVARLTGRKP